MTPTLAACDVDLYRRYALDLTRYATSLVGPDDAADVVNDAVLAAFASPRWRVVENKRAYLYRAVYTRSIDVQRSTAKRRGRETAVATATSQLAETQTSVDAVRSLLILPPQQRAVIFLTYWEDLSVAAIAEMLDVSEGTVRKQLARARERLRKVFS